MTGHKKFSVCSAAITFSLLLYISWHFLYQTNLGWHSGPVGEINHNTLIIGNALLHYKYDHPSVLPVRLSELVPIYISGSNINCFFWPPIVVTATDRSRLAESLSKQIDTEGAFIYLGSRGFKQDLILYERSNLWPVDSQSANVPTLTATNLTPRLRSVSDLQRRLSMIP